MPLHRIRRISMLVVIGILLLCLAVVGLSALSNLGLPAHSSVMDRLSDAEKARLAEAFHVRRTLGDAVWPDWGEAHLPVILYNEEYAFLVGYPAPPPGWIKVSSNEARGGPWEEVPGDTIEGQPYYRQRLPAPEITPEAFTVIVGDHWVASMTTKEWTQIKLIAQLREDLPKPLRPIFPYWLVAGSFNSDWHIIAIQHESFHAYQGVVAPVRLADGENANRLLGERYPWDDVNLQADWQAELNLLARAVQAQSDDEAAELARQFLAARDDRRITHHLDELLIGFERQREWVEGLAKYAELEIWRQAATTPDYAPLLGLAADNDFKDFTTFEQRWSSELSTMKNQALHEGDGRFYYTGMAQAVLLDRLMPGWKARAFGDGVWLEDLLQEAVVLH